MAEPQIADEPLVLGMRTAQQVEAAGLDTMNFHLAFGDIGFDEVCRTAELFAAEVMPAFADAETLR